MNSYSFFSLHFRDSGITLGLDGAIQRLIVNGDSVLAADLLKKARETKHIRRYLSSNSYETTYSNRMISLRTQLDPKKLN